MKVSALNYFNHYDNVYSKNKPHFDGSYEVVASKLSTPLTNFKSAQDVFGKLINGIDKDSSIKKTNFFNSVLTLFKEKGLKGLFKNLEVQTNEDSYIQCMMQYVRENGVMTLAKDEKVNLSLVNYSGKPKDIRFGFNAGPETGGIEFYTDKQGDLFVEQIRNGKVLNTGFYSDTGTKKVVIDANEFETETTYYNKDGSKPFFKNLFLGGVSVKGMY